MRKELQEMNREFLTEVQDFEIALMALDCLENCEKSGILDGDYPADIFKEYRRMMNSFVTQHAEELTYMAARVAGECTRQDWRISIRKEEKDQE